MAGTWGQTVCKRSLDYLWGVTNAWSGTATPYITLSSTLPTATCTNVTEPATGSNYGNFARQAFVNGSSSSGGSCANTAQVTFPTPATFGGFDAKYYLIYLSATSGSDAPTSTTMIAAGTLTQEIICNIGVPIVAAIGAFTLSLSQVISGMTTAGANLLLDVLSGKVAFATNFPAAIYLSLYTTTPTISQVANTNEAGYTSYARVSSAGSMAATTTATPAVIATNAQISFATCTGSSSTIVGWGAGPGASGAGALYFAGTTTSQAIGIGNQPYVGSSTNMAGLS